MKLSEPIYEGKAKRIYAIPEEKNHWLIEYKDSLTAFNALKKGSFEDKGAINRDITSLLFRYLKKNQVPNHWVRDIEKNYSVVEKVEIIPLEVVVRNTLAGSTAKKLGIEEGKVLKKPLVEFYYKKDELADPFVSDEQILMMEVASEGDLKELKEKALQVNSLLRKVFAKMNLTLVDFKIEFGKTSAGQILLADEITPDCCRLWDMTTHEKMDKDRFRRDLGNVRESYVEVLNRLQKVVGEEL
jgi:phosphoribosylaminoimidazole-succinocarboxamide synthase